MSDIIGGVVQALAISQQLTADSSQLTATVKKDEKYRGDKDMSLNNVFSKLMKVKFLLYLTLCIALAIGFSTPTYGFIEKSNNKKLTLINSEIFPGELKVKNENNEINKYENKDEKTLKRFKDSRGGEWVGVWNPWGTIHRLYNKTAGSRNRLKAIAGDKNIQDTIQERIGDIIDDYTEFLKVSGDALLPEVTEYREGIVYCRFIQVYRGVRVYGGGAQFRFDRYGNLLLIAGDTYPGITINPLPAFTQEEAIENARKTLHHGENEGRIGEVVLFVLPIPVKEGLRYQLAWQVPVFTDTPQGSVLLFIDAHTGEALIAYQLDREAIHGRVGGVILPKYFSDLPQWVPFNHQEVYLLNKSAPIAEYSLNEDPGWGREGLWEFGVPKPQNINEYGHAGCPDPEKGVTGETILGYNLAGDYTNLMRPKYLTTDTIYCTNKKGVALTFWRWLGIQKEYWIDDMDSRTDYDRATIELSNDDGKTWTVFWSNGTSQIEDGVYNAFKGIWEGWNLQFFDLADMADGKNIAVRWGIGPTDGSGIFCGWNLDDVGIYETLSDTTDPNGIFEFPNTDDVPENTLVCQLKGPVIAVMNEDGSSAVKSIDHIAGDQNAPIAIEWTINDSPLQAFDEFNVYYHVNLFYSYIKKVDPLYSALDKKGPIQVYVRYGDNYKNAFWSPENKICFGEGDSRPDGYRNFALFSDIIYHEYGHAITDSFYAFFMPPITSIRETSDTTTTTDQSGRVLVTELDAMHEAFSDYWACTINDDPLVGDGDFWVKHRYVRNLENKFKYPDDYGDDAYANSLIISGAMWETRDLFGKEVADTLFHYARYGGATTFADFLIDVLIQDDITYSGEHAPLIKDIFGLRGISRAPSTPGGLVGVAGDTSINLEWRKNPDSDEVKGYYVYFRTENDIASDKEDPSVRRDAKLTTSYQLDSLTNGTTYVIKVTAYNTYNAESPASDYVYATPFSQSSNASSGGERKVFCFIESLR